MTAIYKKIYTKPSLNDVWFFEKNFYLFGEKPEIIESKFDGFISKEEVATISVNELESRRLELKTIRPDLYTTLFETQIENLEYDLDYVINHIKNNNILLPFDAFTTTLTEVIKFDTWENLIFAYETLVTEEFVNIEKNELKEYNNVLVEEFYIDDVKQQYIRRIGS
jgi:hypothetical protein